MKEKEILNNLGLVGKAMKDLHCQADTQDTLEDLFQIGVIGLIHGIDTFNKKKNIKPSTYLVACIKGELLRHFKYKTSNKRNNGIKDLSLNYEVNNDESCELLDLIPSDYNLENGIIMKDKIEKLNKALNNIKNLRYKEYLYLYYGINSEPMNFCQIARKYGVSRQCVQQSIKLCKQKILEEFKKEYKDEI